MAACPACCLPWHASAAAAAVWWQPHAAAGATPVTEVLLARDSSCVRYGPGGRPAKRAKPKRGGSGAGGKGGAPGVTWSALPAALAASGPYVIGLTERGAEARLLDPLNAAGGH